MVIDENLRKAAEFTQSCPFDFVVLELGTNDAKAVSAERQHEVAANLEKLIRSIKSSRYPVINRAKIISISPPYGTKAEALPKYAVGNRRVQAMSTVFWQVAKRNQCLFMDGSHPPELNIETMTADGLHLAATGSQKLVVPVRALMAQ